MLYNCKGGSYTVAKVNEDSYGYAADCAWVLDGSTGLNGKRLVAEENGSDAQWYSRAFSAFLQENLPGSARPLTEVFSRGVETVWAEFCRRAGGEVAREDVPCTVGCAARIRDGYLEYITVGDCCLLIRYKDGAVTELLDDTLCALDQNTLRLGMEISKNQGIPLSQCRQKLLPELRRVRMTMNTPGGYISLADDAASVRNARCGRIPLEKIRDICMVSDGFSEFYGMFALATPEEFMELAATKAPEELFEELLAAQRADPEYTKYPRFKLSDDATVFYGRIGER